MKVKTKTKAGRAIAIPSLMKNNHSTRTVETRMMKLGLIAAAAFAIAGCAGEIEAEQPAVETVDTVKSSLDVGIVPDGPERKGVTYGPVITIKPKG